MTEVQSSTKHMWNNRNDGHNYSQHFLPPGYPTRHPFKYHLIKFVNQLGWCVFIPLVALSINDYFQAIPALSFKRLRPIVLPVLTKGYEIGSNLLHQGFDSAVKQLRSHGQSQVDAEITPFLARSKAYPAGILVVSIAKQRLFFIQNGEVKEEFKVRTGKDSSPTPSGEFTIITSLPNQPLYPRNAPSITTEYWFGLRDQSERFKDEIYGLHVSDNQRPFGDPNAIHQLGSSGCVNFAIEDLKGMLEIVKIGQHVFILPAREKPQNHQEQKQGPVG